jgi:hypothetical protein
MLGALAFMMGRWTSQWVERQLESTVSQPEEIEIEIQVPQVVEPVVVPEEPPVEHQMPLELEKMGTRHLRKLASELKVSIRENKKIIRKPELVKRLRKRLAENE